MSRSAHHPSQNLGRKAKLLTKQFGITSRPHHKGAAIGYRIGNHRLPIHRRRSLDHNSTVKAPVYIINSYLRPLHRGRTYEVYTRRSSRALPGPPAHWQEDGPCASPGSPDFPPAAAAAAAAAAFAHGRSATQLSGMVSGSQVGAADAADAADDAVAEDAVVEEESDEEEDSARVGAGVLLAAACSFQTCSGSITDWCSSRRYLGDCRIILTRSRSILSGRQLSWAWNPSTTHNSTEVPTGPMMSRATCSSERFAVLMPST